MNFSAGWDAKSHDIWQYGDKLSAIQSVLANINDIQGSKPAEIVLQLLYYLFMIGDFRSAAKFGERGLIDNPEHSELLLNVAVVSNRAGDHVRGRDLFARYVAVRPADPAGHDGLCHALYRTGDLAGAKKAGARALQLKDAASGHPEKPLGFPAASPSQWKGLSERRNVIAFSLFGDNPRYLRGALDNALAAPRIFPGWVLRFYCDATVPGEILAALRALHCEIFMEQAGAPLRERLSWRFQVANDPQVGRFLIRDVDSLVSEREAAAVAAWIESDAWFHVMRDWWTHTDLILAGMWGGVAGILPCLQTMMVHYQSAMVETPNIDQWFLRDKVWPLIRTAGLVHDRLFDVPGITRWPVADPEGTMHVGQCEYTARPAMQEDRLASWRPALPSLGPAVGKQAVHIHVATPAYGGKYVSAYVRTLLPLMQNGAIPGLRISFSDIDYADIVTSRNYLLTTFYYHKPQCSHILFWDADMGFDPALLRDMLGLGQDVVGVIAPRRQMDLRRLHANGDKDFDQAYALGASFIGQPSSPPDANGFVEVKRCGTGILLISRAAIDRMVARCPEIVNRERAKGMPFRKDMTALLTAFDKLIVDGKELSEDFSFCHRWTEQCQGRIYAATRHRISHVGEMVIETSYARAMS